MDIKKNDDNSKLPHLILDIENILWHELKLSETNTDSDYNTYSFDYNYACPFISNLNNRDIKLYLWNKDKVDYEYKNIKISILTK